jgi:hypothetical protein
MSDKPRLPRTVYLGAADYDMREKKRLDLLGETLNHDTRIHIKADQSPPCKRDTVLHEVLHAIVFLSGYSHDMTTEGEEALVRTLTPWLLAALRDNPDLVTYLLDD